MKKNVKALIITLPLGTNYGGIMQAHALQAIIKSMGIHADTTTATRRSRLSYAKHILYSAIRHRTLIADGRSVNGYVTRLTRKFVRKNIMTSNLSVGGEAPYELSAVIVGSDQVWRESYVNVPNYMFDFLPDDKKVRRLSYAASFGTEDLSQYGDKLIKTTARLAKKFDGISVREDSGVDIAKKYWGISAEQHVDPTLLLDKKEYLKLITEDKNNLTESTGNLFTYVLDNSSDKQSIVNKVAKAQNLQPFSIMPKKNPTLLEWIKHKEDFVLPRVTQWLKSFQDAEFVITDSFHGCAFSIIFNKPFIAIGNRQRGMARFTSLLKLFGLEDRLVADASEVTEELLKSKIDWKKVNEKIKSEQVRSFNYLSKHLNNPKEDKDRENHGKN